MVKITKAQKELLFMTAPAVGAASSVNYVDSGQSLSIVNRKLFSQEKVYGIESVEFVYAPTYTAGVLDFDTVALTITNCLDTWPVHNGYVKGRALHAQMQELVLEDNPSVKGKWSEFKVYLDSNHRTEVVSGVGNITPVDSLGNSYLAGEWDYSQFILPQHDVDPVTGQPLPADECSAHLLGANLGVPGSFQSCGLVEAYALSRATVQPEDPSVPAGFESSFFNLLTDSGSQEPELALEIAGENDQPPYDQLNYPGGATNGPAPPFTDLIVTNVNSPNGVLPGFVAPCGLFSIAVQASLLGARVDTPAMFVRVTYAPGMYKGVAAIDMGQ